MGKITGLKLDGYNLLSGFKKIPYGDIHTLVIEYDCELWFGKCKVDFDIQLNGAQNETLSLKGVEVPYEGEHYPIQATLRFNTPGKYTITVKAYENGSFQDSKTATFEMARPNEFVPPPNPELPFIGEIPWSYVLIGAGAIVLIALWTYYNEMEMEELLLLSRR